MTNMKAAERAAELTNAQPGSTGDWTADEILQRSTTERAFVQFIADADAAAREVQNMAKECQFSLGTSMVGKISRTLSPFILPDDVDPLLIEARKLVAAEYGQNYGHIMEGVWDDTVQVQRALKTLRRGMELAKEQGK